MHGITQNPTAKYWKICWNLGKKEKRVWRIVKKWKHEERTASQKDLYHNTFWHIIKKINFKSHWIHFLHIHMEIHLFFWDLFLFSVFCCGSQGLLSPWPGDNVISKDPWYVPPPLQLPPGHGDGQEKIRVFSWQRWDWKACVCEECMTCPQPSAKTSPTLWGLKWNLFTSSLWWALGRHSFILHCITYIKTRADKILLGPFFFALLWLCVNFKAVQD